MSNEIPLAKELSELPTSKEFEKAVLLIDDAKLAIGKGEYIRGINNVISALHLVENSHEHWVNIGHQLLPLWLDMMHHTEETNPSIHEILVLNESQMFDTISLFEAPRTLTGTGKPGRLKPKFVSTGLSTKVTFELEGVSNPITEIYERLETIKELLSPH